MHAEKQFFASENAHISQILHKFVFIEPCVQCALCICAYYIFIYLYVLKFKRLFKLFYLFLYSTYTFIICYQWFFFLVLFYRAEGSNLLLDPNLLCKKSHQLRGRHHDICKNNTSLLKEITKGINLGFKECEYQFKNRRWNCTLIKKNMRKILNKGM